MPTPARAPLNPEAVSARAAQLWQTVGSPPGRDLEFWLAAEAELGLDKNQISTASKKTKPAPRKPARHSLFRGGP
jgi:hypothetical protein